jgi:hypothetical protein
VADRKAEVVAGVVDRRDPVAAAVVVDVPEDRAAAGAGAKVVADKVVAVVGVPAGPVVVAVGSEEAAKAVAVARRVARAVGAVGSEVEAKVEAEAGAATANLALV